MAKHPTNKNRNKRQKLKERYMKVREEAMLWGIIEVSPEGAIRDETVKPETQGEQRLPSLDRMAVNGGWAVPEDKKSKVVERLLEEVLDPTNSAKDVANNARALLRADQMQYERDQPERAGKAKGGGNRTEVNVTTSAQVSTFDLYAEAVMEREDVDVNGDEEDAQDDIEAVGGQDEPTGRNGHTLASSDADGISEGDD